MEQAVRIQSPRSGHAAYSQDMEHTTRTQLETQQVWQGAGQAEMKDPDELGCPGGQWGTCEGTKQADWLVSQPAAWALGQSWV